MLLHGSLGASLFERNTTSGGSRYSSCSCLSIEVPPHRAPAPSHELTAPKGSRHFAGKPSPRLHEPLLKAALESSNSWASHCVLLNVIGRPNCLASSIDTR